MMTSVGGCGSGGGKETGPPVSGGVETWHWRNPLPQGNNLTAIAYGNGMFAAVGGSPGDNPCIVTSPDGRNWTVSFTDKSCGGLSSITYGNGLFVAVGGLSSSLAISPDGITWTARPLGGVLIASVTSGGGLLVAVGDQLAILSSVDGASWTRRSLSQGTPNSLTGVAFGQGTFAAAGSVILQSDPL